MNFLGFIFLLLIILNTARANAQSGLDASIAATRDAIVAGDVQQALSAMEAKALDAEEQAATSESPQRSWGAASIAYREASALARSSGQLQKAVAYGTKALDAAQKARQPALQTRAISRLAQAHIQLGQLDKAGDLYRRGIEIAEKTSIQSIQGAQMHRGLGSVQMLRGATAAAIKSLSQALELVEAGLTDTKNHPPSADPKVNRELEHNIEEVRVAILNNLGAAYRQLGKPDEAIRFYEKAIGVIKESGVNTPAEVGLFQGLGQLYLGKKEYQRSLENLCRALELAEKFQSPTAIYSANSKIGELYLWTRKPAEAIPYYQRAVEIVESTRSLFESEELRRSYFEDKRGVYGGMVRAQLQTKNTVEAFNFSERARSRAFLDILGSKVQLARGGTILEQERALQARISALQAMMGAQGPDSVETPQMKKELAEAQQDYNDFLAKVRQENQEQASLMNVEPLTLKQVQELVEPGVTVLEYFVISEAVLLWVVERDRLRFVYIPIERKDLVAKVTALRQTIFQTDEKDKFHTLSQELYKLLIEPALPHIRGQELLIIPNEVLHYLPFQALVSSQGKYLIQDYPIYYLSSASLMQFTRGKERARREDATALAFGNPSLGDEAYNLRFAEREVRELAKDFAKSTVFVKEQATKSNAISLSPQNDLLHFAVHAELNQQNPMSSALLLAKEAGDDGRLRVAEIFSLNLKADMVVLSACETGLGKNNSGDEIIGLTRAFIYAGTPSVVTTLWKVNDRASYELMSAFYSSLKTMKKSEALRQAQLKTMKEFPQPFYWAAYELTGEP